jgi:hypothetical protein
MSRDGVVDVATVLRAAKVVMVVGFPCKTREFYFLLSVQKGSVETEPHI